MCALLYFSAFLRRIVLASALGAHEAEPGFLNRVLRLARRTQHAIGDGA
jgi:hypothetical protein